jgi:hypothetical protein
MVVVARLQKNEKSRSTKHFLHAAPTTRLITFVVEANGGFAVEAQKRLIGLSCAITRMDGRFEAWKSRKQKTA